MDAISRRETLGALAGLVLWPEGALVRQAQSGAGAPDFWTVPRLVWLRRWQTGEELREVYWQDGHLLPRAYGRICHLLRDVTLERALAAHDPRVRRAQQQGQLGPVPQLIAPVSPRLLDGLYAVGAWLAHFDMTQPITVLSGYRHVFHNDSMLEASAKNSLHTQARAVDVTLVGPSPQQLALFGRWLGLGGIGLYAQQGYVHLDDGARRDWSAASR
jgi:uncharacterized protein YcbK (DUF882 family)